jgi:hypothetical protein
LYDKHLLKSSMTGTLRHIRVIQFETEDEYHDHRRTCRWNVSRAKLLEEMQADLLELAR